MNQTTDEILALFGVIGAGLTLGKLTIRGVSLGTSGVVFVALAAGHMGFQVPKLAGILGVVLFVYCLGLGAGPSFMRMFFRQGKALAMVAVAMILSAGVVAWMVAGLLDLSPDLASGLFAGALTSTPALAAASERLAADSEVAVGFGVAYPFGVVGVILFVQLVPRWFRASPASPPATEEEAEEAAIRRILIRVANPAVVGKRLSNVVTISHAHCQISRRLVDQRLLPIDPDFHLQLGQVLMAVGTRERLQDVVEVLGEPCEDTDYVLDVERQSRHVVVTSKELIGHSLKQLHLLTRFGVTVSRINRNDIEFVPGPQERLQFGDELRVVGEPDKLNLFVKFAGHRERTLDETDLISLTAGLMLGVLVGRVELTFGSRSFSLGLAGGPLLVGLVLGHLGHIGPVVGRMPRAARLLLGDVGLAFFLAQAGSQAGGQFTQVLQQHGIGLCFASFVIVAAPLVVGLLVAHYALRLGLAETCGGICGAMTSTPGLGAVMASSDSSLPAASYATVYPLALILITLLAPVLIAQFS